MQNPSNKKAGNYTDVRQFIDQTFARTCDYKAKL